MALQLIQEYEGEWNIGRLLSHAEKSDIVTPHFSPLPDCKLTFHFEASYETDFEELHRYQIRSPKLFKLKLVIHSQKFMPSSFLKIDGVKINYSDKSLFKEYETITLTNFNQVSKIFYRETGFSGSCSDIDNRTLIIKCNMKFYNEISTSHPKLEYETNDSSKKYHDLMKNYKSIYNPGVLCDFVINIGDKSIQAHKVILAAHSPVFMKMLTNEFVESKTNSVTLTDTTPEILDLFLKYLYYGEMEDKSWSSVKNLYSLAHKYDVEILKNELTNVAISLLSMDLVCEIIKFAYEYEDMNLKSCSKSFAVNHIRELKLQEAWKELVITHPVIGYEVAAAFFP